ncbi:MAG: hypothetical protein M1370_07585 [Bacteroidetes bacterium]|nr:hypothetical protein [Bacteroidota bacterium]
MALAQAVDPSSPNRLAGWLAVYDALGIPVLGPNRSPLGTTGDDPIGPMFWRVWYMSGMTRPGTGFRLTDWTKLFNPSGDASFDSGKAGAIFLEDLRASVASEDPQVQLFGRFTVEMVKRGASHVDLLDPTVTADQVVISGDLAELLSWEVIRGLVFSLASTNTSSTGDHPHVARQNTSMLQVIASSERDLPTAPFIPSGVPALEQQGCTSLVSDDTTYWLNWAMNKIVGGGVRLPGMTEAQTTKGLVEYTQLKRGVSEKLIDKIKSATNVANAVANVLTLAMQIHALTADSTMEPSPLERSMTPADGKQAKINFRLMYDPGSLPDGNNMVACVSSYLLNAFGVSFNLPSSQRIPGAELTFEGGMGFGKYVQFADSKQGRKDTDDNGEVEVLVEGKGQRTYLPAQAKPISREFSIHVRGQPEAVTGNTIANTFFDSLTFWAAPSGLGLVSPAVDIAKTFHYDLGEFVFPLKDWATGFRVDQAYGEGHITGTICSGLDKPFTLKFVAQPPGTGPMTGTFTFTPSGKSGGTWSYTGGVQDVPVTNTGTGGYKVAGEAEGLPNIEMAGGQWTTTTPIGSHSSAGRTEFLSLEPATEECSQ